MKTEPKYDVDYFIAKFEAIPEELWTTGKFTDGTRCCAFGHCGMRDKKTLNDIVEASSLNKLFLSRGHHVADVNDNGHDDCDSYDELGSTPKQRIINFLKSLKDEKATH